MEHQVVSSFVKMREDLEMRVLIEVGLDREGGVVSEWCRVEGFEHSRATACRVTAWRHRLCAIAGGAGDGLSR